MKRDGVECSEERKLLEKWVENFRVWWGLGDVSGWS